MSVLDLRAEARARMPIVPDLPHLRGSALATWRGRMVNEYCSSYVFHALAAQLAEAGLPRGDVERCLSFAGEERTHGVLCGAVVEALGGEARATVDVRPPFPAHRDVPLLEGALRNVLSVSCLSETVAVSLIGAERLEMPEGPLRALLTRIYGDEVGHARFGWELAFRYVPDLDAAARARLGAYLEVAFAHLEKHELSHLPPASSPPKEGVALGLCSGAEARELFYDTVEDVIVPRLEALSLPAKDAWSRRPSLREAGGGCRGERPGRARATDNEALPLTGKRLHGFLWD